MAKKVDSRTLLGQRGVNLIEKIVLGMGCLWYPSGQVEAGIDGTIELRIPQSGEATNRIVQVQSKATDGPWEAETAERFAFRCQERDLEYWMSGNAPVLLICSRPRTDEAYWVPVKDYFREPAVRKSRKVIFDKKRDRFDATVRERVFELAAAPLSGLYTAPPPKQEHLYTNLLAITKLPDVLHHADATIRSDGGIRRVLRDRGVRGQWEWLLRSKSVLSFFPLDQPPWDEICDIGTYETFDTAEWSASTDPDRRREFVQLLNSCLRRKLGLADIRYSDKYDLFFFRATPNLRPRRIRYRTQSKQTTREVFRGYASYKDKSVMAYYRHAAFQGHFTCAGDVWFLEIVPTYYFTFDGEHRSRLTGKLLTGIKRLEHNEAVRNQVVMWAAYLSRPSTLFDEDYPYLRFGQLLGFEVPCGIDDAAWLPREPNELEETTDEAHHGEDSDGELFEP